ncbi:wd40 repeat protein 12 37 [Holotrichia oblita]|uniref:Wd40 repeat protein 12 37 n=1 Tax=Holotrichia oblita TaxID=644536 RepID=A0ACB9TFW9_HOLOL|nr:wd40 repeat protein 12 37 [Holotrichia oblita]
MAITLSEIQTQIRFITKQQEYAVPDVPFTVPSNIDCKSLNKLINSLLKESNPEILKNIEFDFLVIGELLRVPLCNHLQEKGVSAEVTVDIEYIQRSPAPQPQDALQHDDWISSVHVADKWVLTGCYDNTINIWSTKGKHQVTVRDHINLVKAVTWLQEGNPLGGFVSVSHDLTGILWHWSPDTPVPIMKAVLRGHERGIDAVGVSPDSTKLATGGWDTNLKLWSAELDDDEPPQKKSRGNIITKVPLQTLKGHKESISKAIWIDNMTICTASMDHTIKLWDAELCGMKNELIGQKAYLGASWSHLANALIACSADRHIRLYDPRSTDGAVCKSTFTSHTMWVSSVAWSQNDEHLFISGGYDNCVKLWDTRSPKLHYMI